MTRQTRRAGAFLVALGGAIAVVALLASPANAQTSGGAQATGGSVASGNARATNQSTASGDAVATNQSTASGCATAINQSTASGDDCPRPVATTTPTTRPPTGPGAGGAGAGAGVTSTARLALTGSWSLPMLAMGAVAMAFGAWLLVAADRRRAASRA